MMDREYLEKIRRREPLADILKDYGAAYYITVEPNEWRPGECRAVREPAQAGDRSPTSNGIICDPPEAVFHDADVFLDVFQARSVH